MITPVEKIANRKIGIIESISPIEIKVNLDVEAPHSIAMGTGNPQLFPRLNGFLLIPCESGFIVGRIGWLSIEPSSYPKRKGMRDFGILDLPFPSRKLKLNMLGILRLVESEKELEKKYEFTRGVHSFPALGDSVLLPDKEQLRSIVESGTNGKVKIGTCPLADDANVTIDPDRLFGRHLAVLGNTGSGKSCTVSGLIKWSLEEAQKHLQKTSKTKNFKDDLKVNARFIILDPNGEYSNTFQKFNSKVFKVYPNGNEKQLQSPSWFWNSHEWSSITQASSKIQKPILNRALREIKNNIQPKDDYHKKLLIRKQLSYNIMHLRSAVQTQTINSDATKVGQKLEAIFSNMQEEENNFPQWKEYLTEILSEIQKVLKKNKKSFEKNGQLIEYYVAFSNAQINDIINKLDSFLTTQLGGVLTDLKLSEDTPQPFNGAVLADHIEIIGKEENVPQYIDFLVMRIRSIFSSASMKRVIGNIDISLEEWLNSYIGKHDNQQVAIIDLSLVPKDITYLVTAVISRMIFEALQRYKNGGNRKPLPTVLVMEEAHTFIQKYRKDSEEFSASRICTEVFERIAKEGRKFGLGLVLSSQRPSELSQTVLSQCNTFLLHRITNDRDQEMVSRLLPDSLKGTMQELPALPSRHAYLLGWASEIPILTKISHLPEQFRPKSDDPDFWDVWTGTKRREVNWKNIADKWQGKPSSKKVQENNNEPTK
ncbi:MAG: DUF87 domain-containing protein [Bdellovibrionales bacterium]|nr:DUF87 domain-containing protein [Bdellovibrionales bacterium]